MTFSPRASARFVHFFRFVRPGSKLRSPEERIGLLVFTLALLFAMTHPLWAHELAIGAIEIEHPWSRAAAQDASVAVGDAILTYQGSEPTG